MTDKDKIINELKLRLHNNKEALALGIGVPLNAKIEEEESLLAFIESLPEEPVSGNHISNAFIDGAKWQKEQMMKDAIDCEIEQEYYSANLDIYLHTYIYGREDLNRGDKVKVIIIKEDKK